MRTASRRNRSYPPIDADDCSATIDIGNPACHISDYRMVSLAKPGELTWSSW